MLAEKNEKIKKAYTVLTTISQDEIERREYEAREMQLYDEISRLEDAREEGREEGIEKGREEERAKAEQEKLISAKELLKMGLNAGQVSKAIGLSIEKILELSGQ